ncbi:hypothetical protein MM239_04660 [Belliella sp. DSM 111904]|uniref:TonB protein C-terminal n=1 Tax=Belliella filtrata TaxID=2923435 RepID=A0ABS9UWX0_9BACT|nr:hypothetical protein [Belliella filtrata]MCH7408676.1 hypothetical protein [Belliella filtrata]
MKFVLPAFIAIFMFTAVVGQANTNFNDDKKGDELFSKGINLIPVLKVLKDEKSRDAENVSSEEDFGCAWEWPAHTSELLASYIPFLFRTKQSAMLDEVRIVLNVNNQGKLTGYQMLTDSDKGLEQRVGHVLRKLPKCTPIPGYANYDAVDFELVIKK